jgi:thiamine biosynthesis protein ThiS
MNLTINGETRTLNSVETLNSLVEHLGMKSDRVAIELNFEIVPREQWAQTPLKDGDRLEIVHFVGGGSSSSACRRAAIQLDEPIPVVHLEKSERSGD